MMENGGTKINSKKQRPCSDEKTPLVIIHDDNHHIPLIQKIAYGIGHVYNDICAAIWFSYALIFLQLVANTGPLLAGILLFIGQVIDAVATPIAGYLVDKFSTKKRWHLVGSLLVGLTFPIVFSTCQFCGRSMWLQAIYYSCAIIVFQSGWALVQIAHLSILPEMTPSTSERAELTAHRYTASMASHIAVYLIAWAFLSTSKGMNMKLISSKDALKFEYIVLLSSGIGFICSLIFHVCSRKKWTQVGVKSTVDANNIISKKKASEFYKSPQLYKVAIIYTSSRLFLTLSLEYMPMFVNETVLSQSATLATVPLIAFLASCLASMAVNSLTSNCGGNRVTYIIGCILCIIGCIFIQLHRKKSDETLKIFITAFLFGAGSSVTMVVSLCVTVNLIGSDTDCGAFVYSAITFADKFLNGVAVIIIENLKCEDTKLCPFYYRDVLTYVNGTIAAFGLIVLMTLPSKLFLRTSSAQPTQH